MRQPSLFDGELLRDLGIEQVLDGEPGGEEFVDRVIRVIEREFKGQRVLFSTITARCKELGMEAHHPNVWGAVCSTICRRRPGLLKATGEFLQSGSSRNHAHRYQLWEVMD